MDDNDVQDDCCVADVLNDKSCHSERFSTKKFNVKISSLQEDINLLYLRLPGLKNIEHKSICHHHYNFYFTYYESLQKKMC